MQQDKRPIELKDGWEIMQSGIDKLKRILEEETTEQFNAEQYMTLYTTIYNMCTQKPPHDYSEQLYNRYKEAFEVYVHEKVLPALKRHSNEILLKEMLRRWENHKLMVRWLSRFFNYLDRYYVIRHNLPNLRDVGLICFRDNVYGEIKRDAKDAILALIEKEREGELIDGTAVKNILNIFIEVGMGQNEYYERDFEEHLLAATSDYYMRKAAEWITDDSCPDYMLKAEERLKLEEARVESYLHPSTKAKLLAKVEKELLTQYEEQLLTKEHSGCAALLRDDKTEDLARMYRLFNRIAKGLEPIADMFKEHVEGEGMKRVREATEAAEAKKEKDAAKGRPKGAEAGAGYEQAFVRGVIELHDKYLQYVDTCFSRSSLFHKALKEAFEAFCNKTVAASSAAELMANFCDNLLKKGGSEKLSDEAIEETLDKVVKLLAFISDKDLFAEFYRKRLSRRLLFDKSASDEHERSILSRLKQQCGAQFTSKMEGMVTDLQLARDKQQNFEDHLRSQNKALKVELTVTVLTTGFWPTYKAIDLALPEEMVEGVTVFGDFYKRANSNRNLTWIYTLGSCSMKGYFTKRPMELQLSTLQAALLLLFNHADELSYQEIQERLHVSDEDVARMLHSLACAKYKILAKEPDSRTIAKTDRFRFNAAFTDRLNRIKVPLPPVDEKKKVIEDVDKDRKYAIDAAIVRTMKSRKQLAHSQLVMEVVQQLTRMFRPDLKLIKKRIEDLIAREYLERDRDNQQLFRYLA